MAQNLCAEKLTNCSLSLQDSKSKCKIKKKKLSCLIAMTVLGLSVKLLVVENDIWHLSHCWKEGC